MIEFGEVDGIKPSGEEIPMKKKLLAIGLTTVCVLSVLVTAGHRSAFGGDSITVQQVEAFAYVCLQQKGPFDKIQEAVGSLIQEMQAQNVVPGGPLMGVYFNSPDQVKPEDLQWEIGFPVTSQALIQPPLQKKEWNFIQVVVSLHQGPYEKTGETIQKMMEWMEANDYAPAGPFLERYMDMNPEELKPEELKTEVWIPCQKKTS
jgi:effector-binding domain-containing protein